MKPYYRLRKEYGEVKACHAKRLQGEQDEIGSSKKAIAESIEQTGRLHSKAL
jgi:hypothetical protein